MATVTSTLKLFDSMTGPIKKITQSMNIMISTMHDLHSATKSNIQVDKMLSAAKQQLASAESEINSAIAKSVQEQNKFNSSVSRSNFSFGKMLGSVFAINEGLELTQQLWNGITAAMERADSVLGANTRLSFINDGLQTQAALQERILDSANRTMSSYRDTADTIAKLGLFAPNLFNTNDRLVNFAETLNKLFVASGSGTVERQIALLQLGQALSAGTLQGDELRSIAEAAPLFMDQLAKGMGVARGELKQLGADGKLTAEVVVKAIEKQVKDIDQLFKQMPLTFGGALTIMGNKFDAWIGKMYEADGPLREMTALMQRMIDWMSSDRGATFFKGMTLALHTLVFMMNLFGTALGFVINTIIDYWPEISAMLLAWGTFYLPLVIAKLWAMIPPIMTAAAGFWAANKPLIIIALAIGLLIFILRQFGVSTEQIIGFVTGLFNMFFAAIQNGIGFVWNNILAFAEFLANIFIDPVYAIQKLFYDMLKNVSTYFGNWANSVIDVLNWLISKINEVTGTTIQAIAKQDSSWVEKFKPESNKAVVDLSRYQMQNRDLKAAFKSGSEWGANALAQLTGTSLGSMGLGGKDIANINKVGEVGKIRDTVDISSEDLRIMRELSEMNAIQNFVSLTPTVQITGDNHFSNGYDIDTVISRINQGLEEEIASSARMVLNV